MKHLQLETRNSVRLIEHSCHHCKEESSRTSENIVTVNIHQSRKAAINMNSELLSKLSRTLQYGMQPELKPKKSL